jgi:hypothetical protein
VIWALGSHQFNTLLAVAINNGDARGCRIAPQPKKLRGQEVSLFSFFIFSFGGASRGICTRFWFSDRIRKFLFVFFDGREMPLSRLAVADRQQSRRDAIPTALPSSP